MTVVLVVDDEPDVRLVARLVLTSAGYDVVEAASGEEALAKFGPGARPDAVLLDVRMKGIDGWETLRRLRGDAATEDLPVVIFTAQLASPQEAPADWQGYAHFLTKPFQPDDLLDAVQAAIGAASPRD